MATLADFNAKLTLLGLPTNETMGEGSPFTAEESDVLATCRRECGAPAIDAFSSIWVDRMVRGMYTNNKGSPKQRLAETVESFSVISKWRAQVGADDLVKRRLEGAELVNAKARATVGGTDYYGHSVVVEQLDGIADLCGCGLTTDQMLLVRAQQAEALDAEKRRQSEALGLVRYKQVYVLDLAPLSLGTLARRSDVRSLTLKVIEVGQKYYPEGMWKIFIVNAPWIFRSVYSIISPFIHPVTRDKIKILGGPREFLKAVEKAGCPRSAVPKCVGGDHPGTDIATILGRYQESEETKEEPKSNRSPSLVAVLGEETNEVSHAASGAQTTHEELLPPIPEQAASPEATEEASSWSFFLCGCENAEKKSGAPSADVPATPPKPPKKTVDVKLEIEERAEPAKLFKELDEGAAEPPCRPVDRERLRTLSGEDVGPPKPGAKPVGDDAIDAMIARAAASPGNAVARPKPVGLGEALVLALAVGAALAFVVFFNWINRKVKF